MQNLRPSISRNPYIDLIRGISIFLVLIIHFHLIYDLASSELGQWIPTSILMPLLLNGHYGVIMFFALSGFLITTLNYRRYGDLAKMRARDFYVYRMGRILPNLALMVGMVFVMAQMGVEVFVNRPESPSWPLILLSIGTFTYNVLMLEYGYFNYCFNTLWSISIEEIFYLFFPIFVLSFKKEKFYLFGFLVFIFLGPLYRYSHSNDANDIAALFNYPAAFDCIAFGCVGAILLHLYQPKKWFSFAGYFAVLGLIITFFYSLLWQNLVFGISLVALFTSLIAVFFSEKTMGPWILRLTKPIRFMGQKSYELYLFHIVLLGLIRSVWGDEISDPRQKLVFFCLFLMASALLAGLISHYFSEPINRKVRKMWIDKSA